MALFGSKEPIVCDICGEQIENEKGSWFKLADGSSCARCLSEAGYAVKTASPKAFIGIPVEEILRMRGMEASERSRHWDYETKRVRYEAVEELKNGRPAQTDNAVHCPRCNSAQISADKKGFGVGKAVIGAAVVGPIGLTAGNIGAKKVRITCLKCGHQWMAGK